MRLLFEKRLRADPCLLGLLPLDLREDFGADAVLHFGTHGALEFMPGKQAGLSGACWPDRLIGDLPNFYLYASNNPSEGTLAKRRAGATLISYLTPPVAAGRALPRAARPQGVARPLARPRPRCRCRERGSLATLIQAQAAAVDLAAASLAGPAEPVRWPAAVLELEYTLIPHGLHVVGGRRARSGRHAAALAEAAHGAARHRRAVLEALAQQRRRDARRRRPCTDDGPSAARASPRPTAARRRITRSRRSCMRSTAASSARRRAATCCARRPSCRPAATCTASIPSASPAPSR